MRGFYFARQLYPDIKAAFYSLIFLKPYLGCFLHSIITGLKAIKVGLELKVKHVLHQDNF